MLLYHLLDLATNPLLGMYTMDLATTLLFGLHLVPKGSMEDVKEKVLCYLMDQAMETLVEECMGLKNFMRRTYYSV